MKIIKLNLFLLVFSIIIFSGITASAFYNADVIHQSGKIVVSGSAGANSRVLFMVAGPQTDKDTLLQDTVVLNDRSKMVGSVQVVTNSDGKFTDAEILLKSGITSGWYTVIGGYENGTASKRVTKYFADSNEVNNIIADAKAISTSTVDAFYNNYATKLDFTTSTSVLSKTKTAFVESRTRSEFNDFDTILDIQNAWNVSEVVATIGVSSTTFISSVIDEYGLYLGINSTTVPSTIKEKFIQAVYDNRSSVSSWNDYDFMFNKLVALAKVNSATRTEMTDILKNNASILGIDITSNNNYYSRNYSIVNMSLANQGFKTISDFQTAFNNANKPSDNGGGGGGGGGTGAGTGTGIGNGSGGSLSFGGYPIADNEIYTDISSVEWAKNAIEYLTKNGIMSGVGNNLFEPNRAITREEFAKILILSIGVKTDGANCSFDDVNGSAWYYPYVSGAYQSGLVKGYSDTYFGIGKNISRLEMVYMVDRAMTYKGVQSKIVSGRENATFEDCTEHEAIRLYQAGVINGVGSNRFAPNNTATRAQAAQIIYGFITAYLQ